MRILEAKGYLIDFHHDISVFFNAGQGFFWGGGSLVDLGWIRGGNWEPQSLKSGRVAGNWRKYTLACEGVCLLGFAK